MATIPKPAPAAKPDRSGLRSQKERTTPPIAAAKPTSCSALGRSPVCEADGDRNRRPGAGDRGDDGDGPDRHAAVERRERGQCRHGGEERPRHFPSGRPRVARAARAIPSSTSPTGCEIAMIASGCRTRALTPPQEVADAPGQAGPEGERSGPHRLPVALGLYGTRGCDGVELVRVVEAGTPRPCWRRAVVIARRRRAGAPCAPRPRAAPPAPRSAAARGGHGRADAPPRSAGRSVPGRSSSVRPTSWRSAAASSRSALRRGWSCAELAADGRHADRVLE